MKTVMISLCNRLMAISISDALEKTGRFDVRSIAGSSAMIAACKSGPVDIALMEVTFNPGFTMEERLSDAQMIRKTAPGCRTLLLCDENSAPELARKVVQAKRDGVIDDFIYSSVSESYLTAMLDAL